jgi:hypothetical protein
MKEKTKVTDETKVEVGCETEELMEEVHDQEKSIDSREVTVHQCESALIGIHQEIQKLEESIKEVDRKAFPFGKWSSLFDKRFPNACHSVHCFQMSRDWPPDGIISFLKKPIGGNAFDQKTVDIVASSVRSGCSVSRIIDFDTTSSYLSESKAEQFVYYCFRRGDIRFRRTERVLMVIIFDLG